MPRTARAAVGGMVYHALNGGNRSQTIFHKPADYDAFVEALGDVNSRLPAHILGYCLMPNHFHLVIRPRADGDLGRWMQRLLGMYAQRYHQQYATSGHVWQGRFKAFPVQSDEHLATVLRYVEQNPVRSDLVKKAQDWRWSSLAAWLTDDPLLYRGRGLVRSAYWLRRVNAPLSADVLEQLRRSVARGSPFGSEIWIRRTVEKLGLQSTIRPRGRPRKV